MEWHCKEIIDLIKTNCVESPIACLKDTKKFTALCADLLTHDYYFESTKLRAISKLDVNQVVPEVPIHSTMELNKARFRISKYIDSLGFNEEIVTNVTEILVGLCSEVNLEPNSSDHDYPNNQEIKVQNDSDKHEKDCIRLLQNMIEADTLSLLEWTEKDSIIKLFQSSFLYAAESDGFYYIKIVIRYKDNKPYVSAGCAYSDKDNITIEKQLNTFNTITSPLKVYKSLKRIVKNNTLQIKKPNVVVSTSKNHTSFISYKPESFGSVEKKQAYRDGKYSDCAIVHKQYTKKDLYLTHYDKSEYDAGYANSIPSIYTLTMETNRGTIRWANAKTIESIDFSKQRKRIYKTIRTHYQGAFYDVICEEVVGVSGTVVFSTTSSIKHSFTEETSQVFNDRKFITLISMKANELQKEIDNEKDDIDLNYFRSGKVNIHTLILPMNSKGTNSLYDLFFDDTDQYQRIIDQKGIFPALDGILKVGIKRMQPIEFCIDYCFEYKKELTDDEIIQALHQGIIQSIDITSPYSFLSGRDYILYYKGKTMSLNARKFKSKMLFDTLDAFAHKDDGDN